MARINIEENWWVDPRRQVLARLTGNQVTADGLAVSLWRVGQTHWKLGRCLIPPHVWRYVEAKEHLEEAGLVEVRAEGIYVRGAEEHFEWVAKRVDSARKGGEAVRDRPRDAKGHYVSGSKMSPAKLQLEPAAAVASSSSSSSSSISSSKKEIHNTNTPLPPFNSPAGPELPEPSEAAPKRRRGRPPGGGEATRTAVAFFCDKWRESRPGEQNYPVTGKDAGQISKLIQDLGQNKTRLLIEAYFQMPDPWVTRNGHSVDMLIRNLAKVVQFMNSGKVWTSEVAKDFEAKVDDRQGVGQIDFDEVWSQIDAKKLIEAKR